MPRLCDAGFQTLSEMSRSLVVSGMLLGRLVQRTQRNRDIHAFDGIRERVMQPEEARAEGAQK